MATISRLDHFSLVCQERGALLVQQTERSLTLFQSMRSDDWFARQDATKLEWKPIPFNPSSKELWRPCSTSSPNHVACWKNGTTLLEICEEQMSRKAILTQDSHSFTISSNDIYAQWGEKLEDLFPYLHVQDKHHSLYLIDGKETGKEKVICHVKDTVLWKGDDVDKVIHFLKHYLQIHYCSRNLSVPKALRFKECCDAVCRIICGEETGTGFVIGNRLLMTNHHVLQTAEKCQASVAEFLYNDAKKIGTIRVNFDPTSFFVTSERPDGEITEEKLDFTIVALFPHPQLEHVFAHPIPLDKLKEPPTQEPVYLIHHPRGKEQSIGLPECGNRIIKVNPLFLYHNGYTDPGSSGSPLLDVDLRIVAIHHEAIGTGVDGGKKAAIRMDAIRSYLVTHFDPHHPKISYWARILKDFKPLEALSEALPNSEYSGNQRPIPPKDFTGRGDELDALHIAFLNNSRVAVTGLGGVGKTALVLKYADKHKAEYQFIHFVPSGTLALVTQGLLQLADDLKVPEEKQEEERLKMLKVKLERLSKKGLLIFDGADQVEVLRKLASYLPDRGQCILLTSRMPEEVRLLDFERMFLAPFSIKEAEEYLLTVTGPQDPEKARELSEKLGNLPLALTHAAGYMRRSNIKIQTYIKQFDQYELQLFNDTFLRLKENEKTILTTWQSSLNEIEKSEHGILARKILDFFAFLKRTPIPLNCVVIWVKALYPENTEQNVGSALAELCDYSMIDSPYLEAYNVHILVRKVIWHQLSHENREEVARQAIVVSV